MIEVLTNWWTGLLVMIAIALLAISFTLQLHEWGIRPLREVSKILNRPWFKLLLLLFFVCGMVQYAATKGTGNGSRSSGAETRNDTVDEIEMTALRSGNSQESGEVTNLCFTGIAVLTNGVELSIAWPTNFFVHGTTLDFFAKYHSITNAWQWFAYAPTSPGMTNLTVVADWQTDLVCESNPPVLFFQVQDRATCATTMADADGDGLPDVYELNNGTNVVATLPAANTNLSWAGYALDQSYSSTADSDGDGLSDYAEIHDHNTDPWLSDSDGDGLTDAEEVYAGTDPKDLYSFYRRVTVVTTTTDNLVNMTNYVAWGTSATGWETNDQSSCWTFPATNVYDMLSSSGPMYVKSFRDLNRNGRYDEDSDIILIK